MTSSKLLRRLLVLYLFGALLAALAVVLFVSLPEPQQELERLDRQLTAMAQSLSRDPTLLLGSAQERDRLWDRLRSLGSRTSLHFTIIQADGTVQADSLQHSNSLENLRQRPEIVDARAMGLGRADSENPVTREAMRYVAVAMEPESAPMGYVRVGGSMEQLNRPLRLRVVRLSTVLAAMVLAGMFVVVAIVRRLTARIEPVTAAIIGIASGTPQEELVQQREDEIGALVQAFNAMNREQTARFSELKRQRSELEEGRALLSTVLEGMIEGVLAVDQRESILFANPAARYMLDLGGGVVGRPIWEAVRNPKIVEVVRQALKGQPSRSLELQIPRSQAVVAVLASRLSGDPCPGVVLVLQDVTGLRRLENLRHEFVSNVSHELKTPLASIQAYTETLLSGALDDPSVNREFLTRIDEQAERLHRLILDMLQLARIESGKDVFEVVAVPLEKAVMSCLVGHEAVADTKGIALNVHPSPQPVRVKADADGLRTILDNLIENAIKYTPEGGRVDVRWRMDGKNAVIEVEDTGVGIAPVHVDRIFERFYRVDKARSREEGGTGLGLAIVKHLVQMFEGRVGVNSVPGKGSLFSVTLPLVS